MNDFKYIFETTNRLDVLKRFVKYNKKVYNLKKHQSTNYQEAINSLNRLLNASTNFSMSDIKEVCCYFTMAEQCHSLYDILHAKFGQLICHYLLGNTLDVESLAQEIIYTVIPEKRNLKGVIVNIGKELIVGVGVVVSFFPPTRIVGVAMTHYGRDIPIEKLKVPDSQISKFITDMREVDFKKLLNNRLNLK